MWRKSRIITSAKLIKGSGGVNLVGSLALGIALALCLIKVFYSTPLRTRIENKLYDIRIRLAPNLESVNDIMVLGLDEETLQDFSSARKSTPTHQNLSGEKLEDREQREAFSSFNAQYSDLQDILERLAKTKVKKVALVLPSQIYNYEDPKMSGLIETIKKDDRFALGVFDVSKRGGGTLGVPNALKSLHNKIYKADMTRGYRRGIIRESVVYQRGDITYLVKFLAESLNLSASSKLEKLIQKLPKIETDLKIRPLFVNPGKIPTMSVRDWMNSDPSREGLLDGKVVILGYTTYRPATFKAPESTFVNTPWQEEGHDVVNGVPLVKVLAMTSHSIAKRNWLSESPVWVNILQTFIISLFSLRIWGRGWGVLKRGMISIGFASFLFISGWSVLLIFHSILFAVYSFYVPLADTALASVFLTTIGALNRLRHEGRLQASLEAKTLADQEVAQVQDRFLSTFAEELAFINQNVRTCLLKSYRQDPSAIVSESDKQKFIFNKAIESCEELDDYLNGIRHFSSLEASVGGRMLTPQQIIKSYQKVNLDELIHKVLGQFEARIREKCVHLSFSAGGDRVVFTDRPILAQILYNLISNAIKYSPQEGKVSIHIEKIVREWRISVTDQGPGIDASLHEKIFEKFYRVKNDYVYKVKGHGLGLYLSQYFAKLINARIEVESALGQGSTFHLVLPHVAPK